MDTPTNTARALLAHLGRGARYGYWWRKSDRTSQYYDTARTPPLPVGQQDVYFGVHPVHTRRPPHERGRIGDVAALNCLFSEFDCKDFGDLGAIYARMETLALWPTVIVHSGGGVHAYWLIDSPWLIDSDTARKEAAALQSEFVALVGGDPGARDLARVLRVPGTSNAKYDPPREVVIAESWDHAIYTLAELREWVRIMRAARQAREPATARIAPPRVVPVPMPARAGVAESVIAAYNARHSITDALRRYGYAVHGDRFTRPGKDPRAGHSGTIKDGRAYTFSSNDPMFGPSTDADGRRHAFDAFDLFAAYEHGGDTAAAVKAASAALGVTRPAPGKTRTYQRPARGGAIEEEFIAMIARAAAGDEAALRRARILQRAMGVRQ